MSEITNKDVLINVKTIHVFLVYSKDRKRPVFRDSDPVF